MKKNLLLILAILLTTASFSQAPQAFKFQTVVRDGNGNILPDTELSLQMTIRSGVPDGEAVYAETHDVITNAFGLVNLVIGNGIPLSGNFADIEWSAGDKYLETAVDLVGGVDYTILGVTQFLSVPYAIHSNTSGDAVTAGAPGQTLRSDGDSWIPNSIIFNEGSRVGVGTENPDNSALLDVNSVNKGFLPPRMTYIELNTIPNPADGLLVYCTDCGSNDLGALSMFMAGAWYTLSSNCLNPLSPSEEIHEASPTQIIWNWNTVLNAAGYKWNTINNFASATDMGTSTSLTETDLTCATPYTRYVWAYSACGVSMETILSQSTSGTVITAPTEGTHVPALNQIVWKWNPVAGATGYKWSTSNDFETAVDMGLGLLIVEAGLTCNTNYTRYVWAYGECENSPVTPLTKLTLSTPINAPTVATHAPSPTQIVWNWNEVSGAAGYKWNSTNDYTTATDMVGSLTKTETGLTCLTEYTRYVWAYNTCGISVATTLTQSTIGINVTAPGTGTHVPSPTQIVWNWSTVAGATGYMWSNTNNYATATDIGDTLTKTEIELTCNTSYTRYVWAYNECGNSSTTTLTQTTSSSPSNPIVGILVPTPTQIVWNWNTVQGATGYKWNITPDYNSATDLGTDTSKTETGLVCITPYTRYVWAYNTCGFSTTTILVQSTSTDPPAPPTSGIHVPTPMEIVWNWDAVPDAVGYWWNYTNNFATATDMGTSTTKTETGLSCGTAYTRYVWATSVCGISAPNTLTQFTLTTVLAPDAGANFTSGTQIVWNWNTVAEATGYKWNTINDYASATDMGTNTSKTETGLTPGNNYTRFVWAYNECGISIATAISQTLWFIGQNYGGGIIFYIDELGQHGLISATSDQSTGAGWGCYLLYSIQTSTTIGSGQANTTAILDACSETGIAARICDDLVLNGYDDWFLPSKDELNQMYLKRGDIGGFDNNYYWTSSGSGQYQYAWRQNFSDGAQNTYDKRYSNYVRAVRVF